MSKTNSNSNNQRNSRSGNGSTNQKSKYSKKRNQRGISGANVPSKDTADLQEYRCDHNDVSWYNANPELLRTAGSLSFNNPLGIDIYPSINNVTGIQIDENKHWTIPGIIRLDLVPTVGKTDSPSSIVNVAARKTYAYVRHENSGHANYDAPDLMLYILAMDNLYSFYNWITRLYGSIRLFSGVNRYFSKYLIETMGVNYEDIITHGNDLYFMLLNWAARLRSFYIPSGMSYLTRHAWLYSQIFKDSPDPKSQVYLFSPEYLYYWAENAGEWALKPIEIIPKSITASKLTFSDIVEKMEQMIAGVAMSEDFNIMSGDILKAYGSNTFTITPVDISYILEPTYSKEVLMQIHNARIITNYAIGDIKSDGVGVQLINESSCKTSDTPIWLSHNLFIDLHDVESSPENVMVASRLMCTYKAITHNSEELDWFGSEIVTHCTVTTLELEGTGIVDRTIITSDILFKPSAVDNTDLLTNLQILRSLASFNDAPIVYETWVESDDTRIGVTAAYADFDNYTIVTGETMSKLHECALLSEFGVASRN
nr:putative capsid [Marmot picobirnavirus]